MTRRTKRRASKALATIVIALATFTIGLPVANIVIRDAHDHYVTGVAANSPKACYVPIRGVPIRNALIDGCAHLDTSTVNDIRNDDNR